MGVWDEYCFVCGGPLRNPFTKGKSVYDVDKKHHDVLEHSVTHTITKYKWLDKLIVINSEEKIYKVDGSTYGNYGVFELDNVNLSVTPANWHECDYDYGVVCHVDCHKVINKVFGYKIMFANVCRLLRPFNSLLKTNYREMQKYSGEQDFNAYDCHTHYGWMLESPLKNKRNCDRIVLIWGNLIERFRNKPPRKSPCEPAKSFKVGAIKKGSDGNDWMIKKMGGVLKWVSVP
jgi:hypothetical protein